MKIHYSEKELSIFNKIAKAADELKMPAYIIGGFVRDKILNRPNKDADIVCIGDGIALAKKTAEKFSPIPTVSFFKNFGTAQIKIFSEDTYFEIEFVGARKESYNPNSRKPDVLPASFDEDRLRRDFTINTLAVSLNKNDFGQLMDPLNALEDIENKIIKTPLPASQTFIDDPLRMMRAIRFATQLNFTISPETFEAIKQNAERINIVSGERIIDEINKIVLAPKPSIGFDLLYKSGLLKIIFPQMIALMGAEYIDGKGHKDNFYHTLQVLDNISANTDDLWLRWSAILHDIAKPATKKFEEGHGWTFHGHEVVGGRMVPKIFAQLKLPLNEKMKFVKKMVELHLRPISLTKENITDSAIRRLLFDAGDDIESLMTLCKADITSKNKQKVQRFLANFEIVEKRLKEVEESDHLRNWQPPITGEIIMKEFELPPSRVVGEIKNAVREAILDGEIPNEYEAAFEYMKKIAGDLGIRNNKIS
ncbi:MAG TPA: HD domain-containing protein [Hanamia sp.]|jgi:putative nucleotidyltransferase with HDIG domain|nr:HD domain-containing protein [Hanamia sp.]